MKLEKRTSRLAILFSFVFFAALGGLEAQGFFGRGSDPMAQFTGSAGPANPGRVLTVGGRLTPFRTIGHSVGVSGVVSQIYVSPGERVSAGDSLMSIQRNVIGENFLPSLLRARITGTVSTIHVSTEAEVSSGAQAVTIIDTSNLLLVAKVSDRDAIELRSLVGTSIVAESPDGIVYNGRVSGVSAEPDYNTGLFELTLVFPRQENLSIGMVLFADLVLGRSRGIAVESQAMGADDEGTFLWVFKDGLINRRRIQISSRINGMVTIESGISEGERYLLYNSPELEEGMELSQAFEILQNQQNQNAGGRRSR